MKRRQLWLFACSDTLETEYAADVTCTMRSQILMPKASSSIRISSCSLETPTTTTYAAKHLAGELFILVVLCGGPVTPGNTLPIDSRETSQLYKTLGCIVSRRVQRASVLLLSSRRLSLAVQRVG